MDRVAYILNTKMTMERINHIDGEAQDGRNSIFTFFSIL